MSLCLLLGVAMALGQDVPARPASFDGEYKGTPLPDLSSTRPAVQSAASTIEPPPLPVSVESPPSLDVPGPAPAQSEVIPASYSTTPLFMYGAMASADAASAPELTVAVPGLGTTPVEAPAPKPYVKPERRGMPAPMNSPPFPGSEYQGYPLIGVPPDYTMWPLMKLIQGTYLSDWLNSNKIRVYGWVTVEGNVSTSKQSNTPDSYWVRPNEFDMDQALIRIDRNLDSVQTDHIDWGFRATGDFGIDYRYFTAGGWFSDQLFEHNNLYGWDLTELYLDVYIPWVAQGMIVRVGRWIACPDIETQFAPDNYMGSHSLLFTFDTYTQTGVMTTFKLSDQVTFQAAVHAGTDMAPWYKGSLLTGACGIRWVSQSNNDAFYGWLNAINSAEFRRFEQYGQPMGHDNFNYIVGTWEHRFNPGLITKTEAYFMWQRNAVVGGTPSAGPLESFGGGGGIGADIPGLTLTFGAVNFTTIELSKRDFITVRNEYWKDTDGERSGFPGVYTSNAIGLSHNFTPEIQFRPEIGYYRNWTNPAFDNGTRKNEFMAAFDFTIHF
jgi:hypothetical protein